MTIIRHWKNMGKKVKNKCGESSEKMEDFFNNLDLFKKSLSDTCKTMQASLCKFESTMMDVKKSVREQKHILKEQVDCLRDNNKNIQCVDESLGNVLLAIRQNEYLQANYPAQHGFAEMKVVGQHPAKYLNNA